MEHWQTQRMQALEKEPCRIGADYGGVRYRRAENAAPGAYRPLARAEG